MLVTKKLVFLVIGLFVSCAIIIAALIYQGSPARYGYERLYNGYIVAPNVYAGYGHINENAQNKPVIYLGIGGYTYNSVYNAFSAPSMDTCAVYNAEQSVHVGGKPDYVAKARVEVCYYWWISWIYWIKTLPV